MQDGVKNLLEKAFASESPTDAVKAWVALEGCVESPDVEEAKNKLLFPPRFDQIGGRESYQVDVILSAKMDNDPLAERIALKRLELSRGGIGMSRLWASAEDAGILAIFLEASKQLKDLDYQYDLQFEIRKRAGYYSELGQMASRELEETRIIRFFEEVKQREWVQSIEVGSNWDKFKSLESPRGRAAREEFLSPRALRDSPLEYSEYLQSSFRFVSGACRELSEEFLSRLLKQSQQVADVSERAKFHGLVARETRDKDTRKEVLPLLFETSKRLQNSEERLDLWELVANKTIPEDPWHKEVLAALQADPEFANRTARREQMVQEQKKEDRLYSRIGTGTLSPAMENYLRATGTPMAKILRAVRARLGGLGFSDGR